MSHTVQFLAGQQVPNKCYLRNCLYTMVTFAILVSQPSSSNYSAFIFIWFSPRVDPEISSLFGKWFHEVAVREWEIDTGEGRRTI